LYSGDGGEYDQPEEEEQIMVQEIVNGQLITRPAMDGIPPSIA